METVSETVITCITCKETYSPRKKLAITDEMSLSYFQLKQLYPSTCLKCIQKELLREKQQYLSNLTTYTEKLNQAHKAYIQASIKKQQLRERYQALDAQQAYIDFFINKPNKTISAPKKKNTRKKKNTITVSKQTELINALLATLSPEQQEAITASVRQL